MVRNPSDFNINYWHFAELAWVELGKGGVLSRVSVNVRDRIGHLEEPMIDDMVLQACIKIFQVSVGSDFLLFTGEAAVFDREK